MPPHNQYTYFAFSEHSEHYANSLKCTLHSPLSAIMDAFYKHTYRQPYPSVFKYFLEDAVKYSPESCYIHNPTQSQRGTHGEGHANGVAVAAVIFLKLYEKYGTPKIKDEITTLIDAMPGSDEEKRTNFIKLLQIAAAFHDTGRLGGAADRKAWEKKGANDCHLFIVTLLINSHVAPEQAAKIATLFSNAIYEKDQTYNQEKPFLNTVIQCADCIEIMRCTPTFFINYLDIWKDAFGVRDTADRRYIASEYQHELQDELVHLTLEWRELIRYQGRLTKPSAIRDQESSKVRTIASGLNLHDATRLLDTSSSRETGAFCSFENDLLLERFSRLRSYYEPLLSTKNQNNAISDAPEPISKEFNTTLAMIRSAIDDIPTAEMKYYLLLLMRSLSDHHVTDGAFVDELGHFIQDIKLLMEMINSPTMADQLPAQFDSINKRYQTLLNLSKTNTLEIKVGYALLHVIGAVAAVLCGIIGGLIGGIAGFARGLWNGTNPFEAIGVGVALGIVSGGLIGFRAPKAIGKNAFVRQLKLSLDGIKECIDATQVQLNAPLSSYETLVVRHYFGGDRDKFEEFKKLDEVTYSINTLKATFVSPTLENYLGHHSLIKIQHEFISVKPVSDERTDVALLEFTTGKSDIKRTPSQTEHRKVSGSKVVEMLLFHEQLQVTHAATPYYLVAKMKQGEVDCLSYVNKILTCTNQKATTVKRFDGTENVIGRNVFGFFIPALNPFAQDVLVERAVEERSNLL